MGMGVGVQKGGGEGLRGWELGCGAERGWGGGITGGRKGVGMG